MAEHIYKRRRFNSVGNEIIHKWNEKGDMIYKELEKLCKGDGKRYSYREQKGSCREGE